MGQAKRRGSFEQRKIDSIQKKVDQSKRTAQEESERISLLTEEERFEEEAKRHRARMLLAFSYGIGSLVF